MKNDVRFMFAAYIVFAIALSFCAFGHYNTRPIPQCEIKLRKESGGFKIEAMTSCHSQFTDDEHLVIRQMTAEEIENVMAIVNFEESK